MAASLMVYVNGRSCLMTKMCWRKLYSSPFTMVALNCHYMTFSFFLYVTKYFNREKRGLILLSVPKKHGLISQSVISRRKDARRGALAEKMGLMLDKSSCLMFEAFEDCKKKRRWQVCVLQFCSWQQVMVWCGWLNRQRRQGCIKEPAGFSVSV